MKAYTLTKTLYIVDDDIHQAKYNAIILKQYFDIDAKVYSNPCEAFKDIMKYRDEFGGIITDAFMYVEGCRIQTGIQLVKEITIDGVAMGPVLFCTSLDGLAEKASMSEHGIYCCKPLEKHIANENSPLHLFLESLK